MNIANNNKNNIRVYSITCPSSHPTYINGFGCTNNGGSFKSSFCGPTSAEYSLAGIVRLAQGSEPPCQSGEAVIKTTTIGFSTKLDLYSCMSVGSSGLILYYLIGGCLPGDQSTYQGSVTFSPTLRYINIVTCANYDLNSILFEASSSSTYSAELVSGSGMPVVKSVSYDILSSFTCPVGYGGPLPCSDIDECSGNNGCISPATCQNLDGGYQCNCPNGYVKNGMGCQDIDECSGSNSCKSPSKCQNTNGGYICSCPAGYVSSDNGFGCQDINECTSETHHCRSPSTCENLVPNYKCNCPNGYKLSTDSLGCDDIDECTSLTHDCIAPANCQNNIGGFSCLCNVQGYELDSTKKKCIDINECSKSNKCVGLSTCSNTPGSYECICDEYYHSILNGTDCAEDSDIILTSFQQKPNSFYTFTLNGMRFPSSPIIKVGNSECKYIIGNDSFIECSTPKGIEVIGEAFVQNSSQKASNNIQFIGAPFITGYSPNPLTEGSSITFKGRNLPSTGNISLKINSIECPIVESKENQIICKAPEGSGTNKQIELINELVSNTDGSAIKYSNPIIDSTSQLFSSGGILTINGYNFGTSSSKILVTIGKNKCEDIVLVKPHYQITCKLGATNETFTQIINLVVDELNVDNNYYFTYSDLESEECQSNCSGNGKCTSSGCSCDLGFSGVACNETSGEIITNPELPDQPVINIDDPNLTDYGYRVSIVRIEELDLLDNNVTSINLLELKWDLNSTTKNKWIYNITLPNQSLLECTFEYFKSATNITFASAQLVIPNESLKLSIKTQNWPFSSKFNSLRIVVETNTTLLLNSSKECAINELPNTYFYNKHLWVTSENSESGIVSRFVRYASIDNKQIIANVKPLNSESDKLSTMVGISLPYFNSFALIDPDFSTLLNVGNNKNIGNCKSSQSSSWRVATGVSIGVVAAVAIVGSSVYLLKIKKKELSLLNRLKNINSKK